MMTIQKIKTERLIEYDILRVLACLMVIIIHSPMPSTHANGLFLSSVSYLMAPCIGIFFMISGALLLPIKNTESFLKKRFTKILFPTLFWSLFYMLVKVQKNGFELSVFIQELFSIPFSPQGNGVLWFMYTLSGLYLLSPILSRWIEHSSQKEIRFYLLLWCITLCYPLFEYFLILQKNNTGILYYFSGYIGYYVLGYYLKKYPSCLSGKVVIPFCVVALLAPVLCKVLHFKVDFYSLFWYLSVFTVILSVSWFYVIGKIKHLVTNKFVKDVILKFSNLSLGIYLVHIFMMRTILWNSDWILSIDSYVLQTIMIILGTLVLSFVFCLILSYLPYSDYLIGWCQKKKRRNS